MCRAQTVPLLIMDVEGTDGRERGEDQDFERKSALFSLACSEVSTVGSTCPVAYYSPRNAYSASGYAPL